jgi:hypothetical protein
MQRACRTGHVVHLPATGVPNTAFTGRYPNNPGRRGQPPYVLAWPSFPVSSL